MAFSQKVKDAAYRRAGGRCECTMMVCAHHTGRCNAALQVGWHAHRRTTGLAEDGDTLRNCVAMCATCHRNAPSYSRS